MTAIIAAAGAAAAGGRLPIVTISNQTMSGTNFGGGAASAGVRLTRGGQYHFGFSNTNLNPDYTDVGGNEWSDIESPTVGDSYEARLVTTTGTLSSGTADSWLALSSTRSWDVSQNGLGTKVFTGTLEIRVGGVTKDTASISLTADVSSV
jgi:hypothetical protein